MRVYCATFYNETNTFSPMLADERDFAPMELAMRGSKSFDAAFESVTADGGEVVGNFNRAALPGGLITRAAYEQLRTEMLAELQSLMPVDLVLLNLHGAMVAVDYEDCEGDLLQRVRCLVGPRVPIAASLDPHAHLTQMMVYNANILVAYREYPHTDEAATFAEAVRLGVRAARGEIAPVISFEACGQIAQYPTTREPMRSLVNLARDWQSEEGVLAVSIIHGFPWGDVRDMGTKTLVVTDGNAVLGARLAVDLALRLQAIRGQTSNDVLDYRVALEHARQGRGPVVVADVADNPGGGAAGDSTFLLRELLDAGDSAAFGPLWDPFVVSLAHKAGKGGTFLARLGGKVSPASGQPIDVIVTVSALSDSLQIAGVGGYDVLYGRSAALRSGSVDILVTSEREQAMSPEMFRSLGIDVSAKQMVVVKSAQHFVAGFASMAADILFAASPGTMHPAFDRLTYRAANLSLWPFRTGSDR